MKDIKDYLHLYLGAECVWEELDKYDLISNLYWLILMCLDKNDDHKSGINYNLSNQTQLK